MKMWTDLAVESVQNPQGAAARIMAWQLPRNELYLALVAVSALTALMASVEFMLGPAVPPELMAELPALRLFERPMALFVLVTGGLVVMVHALFWAGSAMGGKGDLGDMIALMTWLQALQIAASVALLLLGFAVPAVAGLLAMVVSVVAFWLSLHFVSAALNLGSLLRAFGVMIAVLAGLLVGLMFLVTLFGLAGGA